MKFEFRRISFNIKKNMPPLSEPVKITGWEKWINRVVTAALAVWQAVQYLIAHWASNPPIQ